MTLTVDQQINNMRKKRNKKIAIKEMIYIPIIVLITFVIIFKILTGVCGFISNSSDAIRESNKIVQSK